MGTRLLHTAFRVLVMDSPTGGQTGIMLASLQREETSCDNNGWCIETEAYGPSSARPHILAFYGSRSVHAVLPTECEA